MESIIIIEDECIICLSNENKNTMISCCQCNILAHKECLTKWYNTHPISTKCPYCRYTHDTCTNCEHKKLLHTNINIQEEQTQSLQHLIRPYVCIMTGLAITIFIANTIIH